MSVATVLPNLSKAEGETKKAEVKKGVNSLFPKIVRTGVETEFCMTLKDEKVLSTDFEIKVCAKDGVMLNKKSRVEWFDYDIIPRTIRDGKVYFKCTLHGNQEYTIYVKPKGEMRWNVEHANFRVYALAPELFDLVPLKGEFHMHSTTSDGRNSEREMILECCKRGYDFAALGDHKERCAWFGRPAGDPRNILYGYQKDFAEIIAKTQSTMNILQAEEVHLDMGAHFHNFGGSKGVIEWAYKNPKQYDAEIEKRKKKFKGMFSIASDVECMAIADLVFDKVKEFGGISVFNHPTWVCAGHRTMSNELAKALFLSKKCNAYEVVNYNTEENMLALSWINETVVERGSRHVFVGNSDAHEIKNVGLSYTIVFAKSSKFEDIKDAILNNRSLAVDNTQRKKLIMGPSQLADYAYFLEREYFPELKKIRNEEAKNLKEIFEGKGNPQLQQSFISQKEAFCKLIKAQQKQILIVLKRLQVVINDVEK